MAVVTITHPTQIAMLSPSSRIGRRQDDPPGPPGPSPLEIITGPEPTHHILYQWEGKTPGSIQIQQNQPRKASLTNPEK